MWFIDESYIHLPRGQWLYICAIIDSYNNEIDGHEIDHYRWKELALDTLNKAVKGRDTSNVILHTDRGMVYSSNMFRELCKENHITQSMNDITVSIQNRPIEFWFSVLKCEYLRHLPIRGRNLEVVKKFLFASNKRYNENRLQQCLGWRYPTQIN